MRRTDRLFQIIQILRCARKPITGLVLAKELEVSSRTVYRDIAELMAQRVPIRGEAGVGYMLGHGYDLPPLMLTPGEIEAAILGAQWVAGRGDEALALNARDLIAKINDAIPENLRPLVMNSAVFAPEMTVPIPDVLDMDMVREWIRRGQKMSICYEGGELGNGHRTVWPIRVVYFETTRILACWCEKREGFRHFRTDRIAKIDYLDEIIPYDKHKLQRKWEKDEVERRKNSR